MCVEILNTGRGSVRTGVAREMAEREAVEVAEVVESGLPLNPPPHHQLLQETKEAKEERMEKDERMGREARARAKFEPDPAYVLPQQDTDRLRG